MKYLRWVWSLAVLVLPLLAGAAAPGALSVGTADKAEQMVADARLQTLEQATGTRSPDVLLELALAYDEREQYARAVEYYRQAAMQGDGVAELRLGWLCESGLAGEQSYSEARRHYERALADGVMEANLRLGLLYLEGWGVKRDVPKTMEHMLRAAETGYQPAQEILSLMYFSGVGVKADLKKAARWAELAAQPDNLEAQLLAGNIRSKAARMPSDMKAVRDWYQLSAEAEYTKGMRAMATTFLQPKANKEDVETGVRWLELAVENDDGMAGFYLAGIYLWYPQYRGFEGRARMARELFGKSAALGELASREVLELEKEGMELADAFRYVQSEPVENRYIKRLADFGAEAEADPQGDAAPRPLKMVQPVYPAALKLAKVTGDVKIEFVVDPTGRVHTPVIVTSTHPGFADSAIAAISAWRFRAGHKAGRPVNTRVQILLEYRLDGIPALAVERFRQK